MRKYKQVKEKKVTYDLDEWEEVEHRAEKLKLKTGTYIKRISVDGKIIACDVDTLLKLINEINAIGRNINMLTRKALEINSIYAEDMEKIQEGFESLCRTVNSNLFIPQFRIL
ncbi:MAG: plasmid mobilization relaxosome protein MobC [Ruminiclostridium sp.]|nr:plasmid mobilization relaxosome protein MobC [Ruminiclostridium sp.]